MINDKEVRKISLLAILVLLGVVVFFLLKPIFFTIFGGLLLAYVFSPVYKWMCKKVKNRSAVAFLVTILAIIVLVVPFWFVVPVLVQQTFQFANQIQGFNINPILEALFPTASESFTLQINAALDSFVSKTSSAVLNYLFEMLIGFPILLLNAFLMGFVFFFALKDWEKMKGFITELSPLSKKHEELLVQHFKNITDSIVYGQIIVGVAQGLAAGIGFLIFGIPNLFLLTILAIVLSIIPVIGPGIIWIPITIGMILSGDVVPAILFLAYNTLVVSTIDNVIRTYIVMRKAKMSAIISFIGMIGGLFIFGIFGLILGPLILTYFLVFLEIYKEKRIEDITQPASQNNL